MRPARKEKEMKFTHHHLSVSAFVTAVIVALVIGVLLGMLFASAATATTLVATTGSISLSTGGWYEPGGIFGSADWSVWGWSGWSCCAFGPNSETFGFHVGTLTINGVVLTGPCCDSNSLLTLHVDPNAAPEPGFDYIHCPVGSCPEYEAAFTLTGHVNLGDGYDLLGHGTLYTGRYDTPDWDYYRHYEFEPAAVIESGGALLIVAAFAVVAGSLFARYRP
jgi:hypothetical protein